MVFKNTRSQTGFVKEANDARPNFISGKKYKKTKIEKCGMGYVCAEKISRTFFQASRLSLIIG